ncbi:hypothetical protein H9651_08945 [Microbacterium sp. Sa4CUA7]|uniref:Uncharacterized protein n=1 Tax=Microbacterium pullorum TaxID=2762236 RepID=A0ABR8S3S7_9MICO|nr:hypothetical protein [Microbacterium pullorum]MBD7957764.1 hypothetical protein [Microbacterium pullorum]
MDRLHYAGTSIVTGTDIAHALLDYAQALAEAGASATVAIPTVNRDGTRGRSEVLIGPASQLISDAEQSPHDEIVDAELVAHLHAVAGRVRDERSPSPQTDTTRIALDADGAADDYLDGF